MSKKEFIKAMSQDLDAYKVDSSSAKQLFASMKEISDWLKKQEK